MKTGNRYLDEAMSSVLPIVLIVVCLSFSVSPMPNDMLLAFLLGAVLLVAGMALFSMGAELSMGPMGNSIGSKMTKTGKIPVVLSVCIFLGMLITISEPDLQVLANQVRAIPHRALIWSVAAGVGIFLALSVLRMLWSISLKTVLIVIYGAAFALAAFAPEEFLAIAFDSGGVTTGPMTVPFIMSFGIGICAIRSDRHASDDSFGLVAICSVGPIIAVLILSIIYSPDSAEYVAASIRSTEHTVELRQLFTASLPEYVKEVALALAPIAAFFAIFQIVSLRLNRKTLKRILGGLVYTYAGLVIFLTGVNVGFMPAGSYLGTYLASMSCNWIIVPAGMLMGFYIVKAEPAVHVLMGQVEEITDGRISGKDLLLSLSFGVAASVGLSMIRVLTGISVMYFLIPGYLIALALAFFVPDIFTAVAFDSGGVASGPMTAAFLLPFSVGACSSLGGNIAQDAFGVVAMVAMTPLIAIQLLGLIYRIKSGKTDADVVLTADSSDDYTIIEL